jgi:hypothetical protein
MWDDTLLIITFIFIHSSNLENGSWDFLYHSQKMKLKYSHGDHEFQPYFALCHTAEKQKNRMNESDENDVNEIAHSMKVRSSFIKKNLNLLIIIRILRSFLKD